MAETLSPRAVSPGQKVIHTYFPAFDVFRGVGILCVILTHTPIVNSFYEAARPMGSLAVHMFFALSGFLITYRLVEEEKQTGRVSLLQFYKRRARRLLPPAVIYFSTLAILGPGLKILQTSWKEIGASLFFFRNLYRPELPGPWYTAHFWTLSLEEQFYLFWPIVLVLLGPRTARARWVALSIIAATIVWRGYVFSVNPTANVYRPDLLADHLLWGSLLGLIWPRVRELSSRRFRIVAGFAGVLGATLLLYMQPPFWQPFFAFLVAIGFVSLADSMRKCEGPWVVLQTIGVASYDCYIWQSLFLPLAWVGLPEATAPVLGWAQRVPISYVLIAAVTTASVMLTSPRRRKAQLKASSQAAS
jgi:peptidoglycan/LPS O-acetylase OafA/YrhL